MKAFGVSSELVAMSTRGDRGASSVASPAGLKGLWVHEIVQAVHRGDVDLAVHAAKDLPSEDPGDVVVAAVPERASPFDVLVSKEEALLDGASVGSSSLRRRGQLAATRPALSVVDIRGNVDTRLRKLADGEVAGLVLAAAGLARLGVRPDHVETLAVSEMVPAPGQGALAVQARAEGAAREVAAQIDHRPSHVAFEAERMLVALVGGGCALPLGAYAELDGAQVRLVSIVLRADGSSIIRAEARADSPEAVARDVSDMLLAGGATSILEELRSR